MCHERERITLRTNRIGVVVIVVGFAIQGPVGRAMIEWGTGKTLDPLLPVGKGEAPHNPEREAQRAHELQLLRMKQEHELEKRKLELARPDPVTRRPDEKKPPTESEEPPKGIVFSTKVCTRAEGSKGEGLMARLPDGRVACIPKPLRPERFQWRSFEQLADDETRRDGWKSFEQVVEEQNRKKGHVTFDEAAAQSDRCKNRKNGELAGFNKDGTASYCVDIADEVVVKAQDHNLPLGWSVK